MQNTGIGFIVCDGGFACSDDTVFDVERDPVCLPDGKKSFKETTTLKLNFIFEWQLKIQPGMNVLCLFKAGDQKYAFNGQVRGKSGNLTVIDLSTRSERINEIIAKIKSFKGEK